MQSVTPPPQSPSEAENYLLENSVGHLLRRAHQRHGALFASFSNAIGLTPTQFAVMVRLLEEGQTTQNRLGRLVALDTATIQGVMQRLIGRGLAQSGRDPMDRRAVILSLTDAGKAVLHEAMQHGREANEALLSPLNEAERAQLVALLRRVVG